MGYRRRVSGSRNSGRGRRIPRHEKAKAKKQKHESSVGYAPEEDSTPKSENIVERTVNSLRNLGKQVFAVSPFSEHFDRWIMDVRVVLSELESSPALSIDDEFKKESTQILIDVELRFEDRKRREVSAEKAVRNLADNRILLEKMEEEYSVRKKAAEKRKANEFMRLSSNMNGLREEAVRISQMKTGIFRGVSKKAKARKEADARQRLSQAEKELSISVQDFDAQHEKLKAEYEKRKEPVIEQVKAEERELEDAEIDHSLETRQAASEALINAVNSFFQRKSPPGQSSLER